MVILSFLSRYTLFVLYGSIYADCSIFAQHLPVMRDFIIILDLPLLNTKREATDLTFALKILLCLIDVDAISISIQILPSKTRGNEESPVVRCATSCFVAKSCSYRISKV